MQVYAGFPQLLFTRSLIYEKALRSGAFCEEKREKETEVFVKRDSAINVSPPASPVPAQEQAPRSGWEQLWTREAHCWYRGCWGGWGHGKREGTWHPLHAGPAGAASLFPLPLFLCCLLCANREAEEVLLCVGQLVCNPTMLPLSALPAFLLAGARAPGETGHAMLGGEDAVQLASRPQDGATVLPDGFRHPASLFLHGTKALLWWSGRVCSWLC